VSKSLKLRAAEFLFRWNLSASIISIMFSALAFIGIFALVFAAPWYVLLLTVVAIVFGTGFVLDRGVRIWEAQALVGTIRNPWLVDRLYSKELLMLKTSTLPQLEALRFLLTLMPFSLEPKHANTRNGLVLRIDQNISRIKQSISDKKWTIEPGEDVYAEEA